MYWTLELASHLEDAPWPATKDELIDYALRMGAPMERRLWLGNQAKFPQYFRKARRRLPNPASFQ